MLIPRRVKHRKQHHPDRGGKAKGGTAINFGEFAIQALAGLARVAHGLLICGLAHAVSPFSSAPGVVRMPSSRSRTTV